MSNLPPIVSASELQRMSAAENLKLIEASGSPTARAAYESGHLRGALFMDLETQLSSKEKDPVNGGRHPLPTVSDFVYELGQLGLSPGDHLIVYDRLHGANAAARLWWMLTALGHEKVQVLNGGYQAALDEGFPTAAGIQHASSQTKYPAPDWCHPMVNLEEVKAATATPTSAIVDVREPSRYAGIQEPIDLIAGHIPSAINLPFADNLDANGLFRSPGALKAVYQPLFDQYGSQVIFHCGSGVTACHSLLAIAVAGLPLPSLYVGSWSEWSRNNLPIERSV